MAFYEVEFDRQIATGAQGGPKFKTEVLELGSGFEFRNQMWSKARAEYDVSYGLKTQEELDIIRAFFYDMRGRAHGFRYYDWNDRFVTRQSIGTTDGTNALFQAYKTYGTSNPYNRVLYKLILSTVRVWVGGVELVRGSGYTVNENTGLITLTGSHTTPDLNVELECEFHVPVRFDTDLLNPRIEAYNNYTWGQIPLVEIRIRT